MICALCFSLGGHWLALQSLAWTTMLVENAHHTSLTEAVAKTFDGAHPCALCHAVAAGKKSEKKSETLPLVAKIDLLCPLRLQLWQPPATPCAYPAPLVVVAARAQAPPAPPPRFVLG